LELTAVQLNPRRRAPTGGAEGGGVDGAARAWRGRTQGVLTPRADAVLRGLFVRPSSLREFSLRAHPTVHALAAWGDHRTRCVVMVDFLSDYLIVCLRPKSRPVVTRK
jgi:hypothetical protein